MTRRQADDDIIRITTLPDRIGRSARGSRRLIFFISVVRPPLRGSSPSPCRIIRHQVQWPLTVDLMRKGARLSRYALGGIRCWREGHAYLVHRTIPNTIWQPNCRCIDMTPLAIAKRAYFRLVSSTYPAVVPGDSRSARAGAAATTRGTAGQD